MKATVLSAAAVAILIAGFAAPTAAEPSTMVVAAVTPAGSASASAERPVQPRHVDLAICLDTSGSMSGLIESAKQKLWAIVNELAAARPRPVFRVALYHYGNDGLNAENGWVQQLCPLTDDLDAVYGELFKLRTNGGTELVARVTRAATQELDWSEDTNALRIIVVAGNEPATQDKEYKLQDICHAAAGKGIIVNTIFCGSNAEGENTGWADAARWADGRYASIDQNSGTVVIQSPYDDKLADLSAKLNETYVAYGAAGETRAANQAAQDANAAAMNAPAAAQRAEAKATALYRNAEWDLVDAADEEGFDLAGVKKEDLPEPMREMSAREREEYVARKRRERARLQDEIKQLGRQRDAYVREQREKQGLSEGSAFDAALRQAVREQAESKGMAFETQEPVPAPEGGSE
jgi:hypothetical protein